VPFQIDKIISAGLFTKDGEKVLDLTNTVCDISCETIPCQSDRQLNLPSLDVCLDIEWSIGAIKRLNNLAYGWKAKGPVRKRLLRRLWGLRR
jgi:hypothetical protein